MTARISIDGPAGERWVRVEGRLCADVLGELESLVEGPPRATRLLLGDLRSLDAPATRWLRRIEAGGVVLADVPPHLLWRIEDGEP